jgi:hypothetical protein
MKEGERSQAFGRHSLTGFPVGTTTRKMFCTSKLISIQFIFSEEILQAVLKEEEIVNNAIAEVVDFCSRHEWVMEVQKFVRTWNKTILTSWRGRPTETIEVNIYYTVTCVIQYSEIYNHYR